MEYNKQIYSAKEFYHIFEDAMLSMKDFKNTKDKNLIDDKLQEKIMLSATGVNGCKLCSVHHIQAAEKSGISKEESQKILNGDSIDINSEEGLALLYAQHYAETKGKPDKYLIEKIYGKYGEEKAKGIEAMTKVIMMGNAYGIAYGSLKERLKGKKVKDSSLLKELSVLLSIIIYIPIVFIKKLFK